MNKQVIISDVWYTIDNKNIFIYEWPEHLKENFKKLFQLI